MLLAGRARWRPRPLNAGSPPERVEKLDCSLPAGALQGVALASGGAFAALAVGVALAARPAFDVAPVAARLHALEAQGVPLADEGK